MLKTIINRENEHSFNRLVDRLHDRNMNGGEIESGASLACAIVEFEADNCVEFTSAEIAAAVWNAGESFVDSMVSNEHDTVQSDYTWDIGTLEDRIERWEKLRPTRVRREAVLAAIS